MPALWRTRQSEGARQWQRPQRPIEPHARSPPPPPPLETRDCAGTPMPRRLGSRRKEGCLLPAACCLLPCLVFAPPCPGFPCPCVAPPPWLPLSPCANAARWSLHDLCMFNMCTRTCMLVYVRMCMPICTRPVPKRCTREPSVMGRVRVRVRVTRSLRESSPQKPSPPPPRPPRESWPPSPSPPPPPRPPHESWPPSPLPPPPPRPLRES